jgi:hypothetical protein
MRCDFKKENFKQQNDHRKSLIDDRDRSLSFMDSHKDCRIARFKDLICWSTNTRACAIIFTVLAWLYVGCSKNGGKELNLHYPTILPVCFIEEHPNKYVVDMVAEGVPFVKYDHALVIPMYYSLTSDGDTCEFTVREPFVMDSNGDVETGLKEYGRREYLERVIIWVPGYLPVAIPSTFRIVMLVDKDKKTIKTLCKEKNCGSSKELAMALKRLLNSKDFLIGPCVDTRKTYSPDVLVRTEQYGGVYSFSEGTLKSLYPLWAFNKGTKINIDISESSKKAINEFLEKHLNIATDDECIISPQSEGCEKSHDAQEGKKEKEDTND